MSVALFDAQRVDGPVSGVSNAKLSTSLHHCGIDGRSGIERDVQLPTHFSDKGDTQSSAQVASNCDQLMGGKGKILIGEFGSWAQFLQQLSAKDIQSIRLEKKDVLILFRTF